MREKQLEKYFSDQVKKAGGLALKFGPEHMAGMPDRLVILSDGRCVWAEVKAPGEKLRAIQEKRKKGLEAFGHRVYVIDSKAAVRQFLYMEFGVS